MITLAYKNNKMTSTPAFDWSTIIGMLIPCLAGLIGYLQYLRISAESKKQALEIAAKSKKEETVEFIERISEAAVNKTLDKVFAGQNEKINKLFDYRDIDRKDREADRRHWDDRFDKMMDKLK